MTVERQQRTHTSERLAAEASSLVPGGVNSPARAFRSVGGGPRFFVHGAGSHLFDADGNEYLDYVGSWGPLILGHAHQRVVKAVAEAAARGTSFGAPTPVEVELARLVVESVPSIEMVRFVSSGTEACMTAIRIARAATGRDRIVKFAGGYHGHADPFLVQAGSGNATLGRPDSAGVPAATAALTLVAPYNDSAAVEALFTAHAGEIAAVIVEPIAANIGVVAPKPGFLESLRSLTRRYGALLIFDEVISGFRIARGGAQELYGVPPDLTCLGKIVGGGLPVGAVGGSRRLMELLAPLGPVYQAGTLSGNPLAMAAGIETLRALFEEPDAYRRLEGMGAALEKRLREEARAAGAPTQVNRVGSMLTVFFTDRPVTDFETASNSDRQRFARFFQAMLARGVYLPPSQFEAWFLSLAHTKAEVEQTAQAASEAFQAAG